MPKLAGANRVALPASKKLASANLEPLPASKELNEACGSFVASSCGIGEIERVAPGHGDSTALMPSAQGEPPWDSFATR
jgi:hypothetical protein